MALLAAAAARTGLDYEVINASITGDTHARRSVAPAGNPEAKPRRAGSSHWRQRRPARGFALQQTAENLREMIRQGRATGASVLLHCLLATIARLWR